MMNDNLDEAATMIFIGPRSDVTPGLDGLFPDSCDCVVRPIRCSSDKPALIEELVTLIGEEDPAHTLLAQKAALMVDDTVSADTARSVPLPAAGQPDSQNKGAGRPVQESQPGLLR